MPQIVDQFFDNESDSLQKVWKTGWGLIQAGVYDRNSSFHIPTAASLSAGGLPVMRTMILRGVDVTHKKLWFHTDRRSAKFSELSAFPKMSLHFYDPSIKIQIRLEANAQIHSADPLAFAAWENCRPSSRLRYATNIKPGIKVASPPVVPTPRDAEKNSGYANFCVVLATVYRFEWLRLADERQERAAFMWGGEETPAAYWIAP